MRIFVWVIIGWVLVHGGILAGALIANAHRALPPVEEPEEEDLLADLRLSAPSLKVPHRWILEPATEIFRLEANCRLYWRQIEVTDPVKRNDLLCVLQTGDCCVYP